MFKGSRILRPPQVLARVFNSPPHFHAKYNDYPITVEIETGVVEGRFPKKALSALLEWLDIHKDELKTDWQLAIDRKPLNKIEPLE